MKLFNSIKSLTKRTVVAAVISVAALGIGLASNSQQVSAAACDKVNIIYCGLDGSSVGGYINSFQRSYNTNTSGHSQNHGDIKKVFNYAGASQALVNGMNAGNTKVGTVNHNNGNVVVDGRVVATNSRTAARFQTAGSTHVPGTNVYFRSNNFVNDTEKVIVRFHANGEFAFASIIHCGNAIKGNPTTPPTPQYNLSKEVSKKGENDFKNSVTVEPGKHVIYRITVRSTGNTPVKNVNVKDVLPAAATYVNNTLTRDGNAIQNDTKFFNDGYVIESLKDGDSTTFKFEAIIGKDVTVQNCEEKTINNVGKIDSPALPPKDDNAEVDIKCQPQPEIACKDLTATPGTINQQNGNQKYNFEAVATAKNATVVKQVINFGDGTSATNNTGNKTVEFNHTYAPGTYTAQVTVTFKDADGKLYTRSGDNCKATFTVKPLVSLVCKSLTPALISTDESGNRKYTFDAAATAENIDITGFSFNFGDGTPGVEVTTSNNHTIVEHTFAPGEYTVTVTVKGEGGRTATSEACKAKITVPAPSIVCKDLVATPGAVAQNGDQSYTLTATAEANITTIESYTFDFGDNTADATVNTASTTHTYAPGDYTATVTVNGSNGSHVTSPDCKVTIHVDEQEEESSLVCNGLVVTPGAVNENGSQSYTLTATASATNATITSYVFNFGDSASATVTTGETTASTTHTYAPGTWSPAVTVNGTNADGETIQSTNANCTKTITVIPNNPNNPNIKITKVVDGVKQKQVNVGQNFVYQLVITNTGEKDLVNALVTDQTPAGVTLISADLGTIASNNWSHTIPSLTVGQSVTVNITAVINTYVAGGLVNTACVNAPEVNPENPEAQDSCDTATVTVTPPVTTPPVTTPPAVLSSTAPRMLVATGAGSVVGIFAAVAAVSAVAHRLFLNRKLSN